MFHSDPVIVGLTVVGLGVPLATLLGRLPGRRGQPAAGAANRPASRPANPPADAPIDNWRLSRKVGNVFALTNLAGISASDVEIMAPGADVDVVLRGAPWTTVPAGGTVEFVAIPKPPDTGAVVIRWKTQNGTPNATELAIAAEPGAG